jgi:cell wall-associated NlpC family hydrolase
MNKGLYAVIVIGSLPGAIGSCWAGQTKHHPWFSKRTTEAAISPTTSKPIRSEDKAFTRQESRQSKNDPGRRVVQQALRYRGTKYKYGGTTKRGLDCSGLVDRVWADLKMQKIPRVSSALYNSGKPVHLADLRPGDLVFFKNTYKRGISHVGVYAGNNKFVHAANHRKGVTITRLSDPYYQLHYAGARRLY